MEKIYDVAIIGGGPAGYSAALYAVRAGLDAVVIEKMSVGGQMLLTDTIDNYPGFDEGIDGFTLAMKMQAGAERFGAKTEYAEVLSSELSGDIKRIETSEGVFSARSVIIATGAEPRELGLSGERELVGRGVHYCAHCDGRFYRGKTVIVVGGGNSAVTDALYLSHLADKVYLVHRRDSLRASRVYHNAILSSENTEVLWNSAITELEASPRLSGVKLKNTLSGEITHISADAVFVSIGRKPTTYFLPSELAFDEHGYVIADESTRTNIAGVFAAGDIRTKTIRQVITAAADGAVAASYAEQYISAML